jgi:hypothetical protein
MMVETLGRVLENDRNLRRRYVWEYGVREDVVEPLSNLMKDEVTAIDEVWLLSNSTPSRPDSVFGSTP